MQRILTIVSFVFTLSLSPTLFANDRLEVLQWLVNEKRAQYNLDNLRINSLLYEGAFNHAKDMASRNYFSHFTPEGWGVGTRIYGLGLGHEYYVLENIASGYQDPHQAFDGWMASPGHREHILNPDIKTTAFAHFFKEDSDYGHYWVMISSDAPF